MRRPLAWLALLLLLPGAAAHAVPLQGEIEPEPGARLEASPAGVRVAFTEEIYQDGSWIQVWDAGNQRVDNDDLHIETGTRPVMTLSLPPLPDGAYRIVWQTYSKTDGHTVGGAIGFAVGGFAPPETQAVQGAGGLVASLARVLVYAGMALGLGVLAWRYLVRASADPAEEARLQRLFLVAPLLVAAGLFLLVADTVQATGLGWRTGLGSEGARALLRRLALAVGLALLTDLWSMVRLRATTRDAVLAAGWGLLLWWGAGFGHASIQGDWAVALQFLHAVATTAWVGGLILLAWTLRSPPTDAAGLGLRFGRWALRAVIVLAVTGVALSTIILGADVLRPWRWIGSGWGAALAGKVALAVVMVGLAGINRWIFLAEQSPGPMGHLQRWAGAKGLQPLHQGGLPAFRRFVQAEAATGCVVLVLAGFLMASAAPTPGLAVHDAPFEAGVQGDDFIAGVTLEPYPVAGSSPHLRLYLSDQGSGAPVQDDSCGRSGCVSVRWWPDAEGEAGAQGATLVPEGDGWWDVDEVLLAVAGNHTFELRVQTGEVFQDILTWTVPVLAPAD